MRRTNVGAANAGGEMPKKGAAACPRAAPQFQLKRNLAELPMQIGCYELHVVHWRVKSLPLPKVTVGTIWT